MCRDDHSRWGRTLKLVLPLVVVLAVTGALVYTNNSAPGEEPETPATAAGTDSMTLKTFESVEVQKYPWGWIRWTMNSKIDEKSKMTFGVVYIKPHQTNPLHLHPKADEILHVVEGACEHRMGKKWVKMKVGDTIRIPKGVVHNARTLDESCRVVVVYDTGERKMVPVDLDRD